MILWLIFGGAMLAIGAGCLVARRLATDYVPLQHGVTVTASTGPSHRPSRRPEPIVAKLQLTQAQRTVILNRYDEAYTQSGVWADIKLQAFVDMLLTLPKTEAVPVFFAQKRILLAFAVDQKLSWLVEAIERGVEQATKRGDDNSLNSLKPGPGRD